MSPGHPDPHGGEKTAISGVIAGLIDTFITFGALLAARSSVLLADGLKTFLEFLAVLLSWMALRRIRRGGHHYFDYGLDKLEDFSSLLVAVVMLACLGVIVVNAVLRLVSPAHITGAGIWVSMGAQVVYAGVNGRLFRKNRQLARRDGSPVMESQARLFLSKAIANGFILLSLVLSMALAGFGWSQYIDPVASLGIAVSILLPAVGVFSHSFYDLLDRTLEESHKLAIIGEIGQFAGEFADLHGIRSRRAGKMVFIDIELEFDPDRRVGEIQDMVEKLRRNIEKAIPSSRVTIGLATARHSGPGTAPAPGGPC